MPLTRLTHASAEAFGAGTLPPPLSTLPAKTQRSHLQYTLQSLAAKPNIQKQTNMLYGYVEQMQMGAINRRLWFEGGLVGYQ